MRNHQPYNERGKIFKYQNDKGVERDSNPNEDKIMFIEKVYTLSKRKIYKNKLFPHGSSSRAVHPSSHSSIIIYFQPGCGA
jgi:hypothetical protein